MTTWKSNLSAFKRDADRAAELGVIAAAYVLVNSVKRALRGGYKSGDFVTGNVINSVTRGTPFREGSGWSIRVGTNVKYALYWEIGHFNAWTRRYEREERWRPAFMDARREMVAAYSRTWKRHMKKWEAS